MKNIQFPVQFTFKIGTLSNDFLVEDAMGNDIGYVRQKMLKLVDEVVVYDNDLKSNILFTIKANKWIDFSATYTFTNHLGQEIGRIGRKGWASIWKARYEIFDEKANQDLLIQEENGWVKVADAVLSEIPILGLFTGYLFNPSYMVTRPDGTEVIRLKKQPSLVGRRFSLEKLNNFEPGEEERVILGLMMMILMERRRG
ncbi:hypothetical protein [Haliscomenobacter sp.]|uniref:hypothetical protein n=1 Tax=Haliscomenobacter sp. TaxID=2717303 RepID=UPI003593F57A